MLQNAPFQMFIQTLAEMLAADRAQKVAERQQHSRTKALQFQKRSSAGADSSGHPSQGFGRADQQE